MRNTLRVLAGAALAFSLSACAGGAGVQGGPLPSDGPVTRVQVKNNNWSDMTVYVERNGMRTRLGTVVSMAKQIFQVPRALLSASGDLRLVADPIGSREVHVSQPVQVWPGQTLDFTIENHVAISSVSVWEN